MHRIRVSLGPYGYWLKRRDEDDPEMIRDTLEEGHCSGAMRVYDRSRREFRGAAGHRWSDSELSETATTVSGKPPKSPYTRVVVCPHRKRLGPSARLYGRLFGS
jgi:hypothetical protein